MKARILTVLLLLLGAAVQAQYYPTVVTFKDGTVKKGLADNPKPDAKTIKFKDSDGADVQKLQSADIHTLALTGDNGTFVLEHIAPKSGGDPLFMVLMVEGAVNMYKVSSVGGKMGQIDYYLVKRPMEAKATTFNGLGARKRMSEYLKDDPETVRYLQETPLLKIDMVEVIKIYNRNKKS